jgi:CHASE3 domain sensor protein
LVEANRLERLVIDLETGQRGFIITGEQRFLEPWRDARVALPSEASTLETLVADSPQQEAGAHALTQATESYLRDYSIPLVDGARRDLTSARSVAATSEGGQRITAIRAEFDRFVGSERELAAARERNSDAAAQRAVAAAVAGLAGSILLIVLFAWYLNRAIVGPVRRAAVMADRPRAVICGPEPERYRRIGLWSAASTAWRS